MHLSLKEVARLFRVSEAEVRRWIARDDLPATEINGSWSFHRAQLLEWATLRRLTVSGELFANPEFLPADTVSLAGALAAGGLHPSVSGRDQSAVLRAVVDGLPLPDAENRELLFGALMMREQLGSTGVGDGIAIPHVRNPVILRVPQPLLALCFLKHPVDFHAADGKPVDTLFVLVSTTVRIHLQLLARLSALLGRPSFRRLLASRPGEELLLEKVRAMEPAPVRPA